jgi:hypothetical protein
MKVVAFFGDRERVELALLGCDAFIIAKPFSS